MQNNNIIRPKFLVFPEIKYAAKHVANLVLEQIKANSHSVLGLPTGETPVTVYKELINLYNQNKVSFKNVTTFNLDEYIGLSEADYVNTYRHFMKTNFFDFVDINPSNVYFPASYTDPENCVADYTVYDNLIASKNYMDLLILGVGENGHIGFNEPFTDINSRTHLTSLTENTIRNNSQYIALNTKTPVQAVTMGLSTILSAKKIVLIAFGAKKANALSKLFFARDFEQEFPITSLINNPNVTIICDKEAASAIIQIITHIQHKIKTLIILLLQIIMLIQTWTITLDNMTNMQTKISNIMMVDMIKVTITLTNKITMVMITNTMIKVDMIKIIMINTIMVIINMVTNNMIIIKMDIMIIMMVIMVNIQIKNTMTTIMAVNNNNGFIPLFFIYTYLCVTF